MPIAGYALLAVSWVLWFAPFVLVRMTRAAAITTDRRARWGIVLQGLAYAVLWQGRFWARVPTTWQWTASIALLFVAILLSWTAPRALGRQWRVDAALNADHALVRSGPYRVVRHPIYASMFALLLGTGALISPPFLFAAAAIIFIAGTEIRVRIEDGLLASRFGETFRAYQRSVSAYVPFVR